LVGWRCRQRQPRLVMCQSVRAAGQRTPTELSTAMRAGLPSP